MIKGEKGKFWHAHAQQAYRSSRGLAPLSLIIGNRRTCALNVMSLPFSPGKETRYTLNRRLVGYQNRSGRFEEERNGEGKDTFVPV